MPNRGVVYIADQKYKELLLTSLLSLREKGGEPQHLPVTVYTFDLSDDWRQMILGLGNIEVVQIEESCCGIDLGIDPTIRHRLVKALLFQSLSPYNITLCLDADTMVVSEITEVFDIVENSGCEIAAVSEPEPPGMVPLWFFFNELTPFNEANAYPTASEILGIDYPSQINIPYFNTGVICGKKGSWASEWLRLLQIVNKRAEVNKADDQLPFQVALINAGTKIVPLNPSWNFSWCTLTDADGVQWSPKKSGPGHFFIQSSGGQQEALKIYHSLNAIRWLPRMVYFPMNKAYADYATEALAKYVKQWE